MADLLNLGMFGKKPLKDQVTPYKMALLVLVSDYCVQIHERSQVLSDDENTYTEKEEREILFTILQLLQVPVFCCHHFLFYVSHSFLTLK